MDASRWLRAVAGAGLSILVGAPPALAATAPTATAAAPAAIYDIPLDFDLAAPAPAPQPQAPDQAPAVQAPPESPVETAPLPAPPPTTRVRYIRPFPVVRIAGSSVTGGAYIKLLRVTAPRGSKVDVRCRGKGCPLSRRVFRPGRIHPFERFLPARLLFTIRVTRASYVGKYVRLLIRSNAAPDRRDGCLLPGRSRPSPCPK
jgi:hypothetical protein